MILYCVRHGETTFNAGGRIQGQFNSELSAVGRQQCAAVARALGELPIEAVYSSPLARSLETAQVLADVLHVEVKTDPRLMEINAGIFQGLQWDEIAAKYPSDAVRWKSQDPDFRIPGGESRRDVMHRAGEALGAIREASFRHVAIISHGGFLSAAIKVLVQIPAELNPFSFDNGSISKLAWDDRARVKLLSLNQVDHLHGLRHGGEDL